MLAAYLSLLTITGLNLVSPLILRWAIDSGISRSNMQVLQNAAALLVVLSLIRSIFQFLQGYLSEVASQGVAFDLRRRIYEHLEHLSFSYHDQAQTGQLMARATSDVEVLRNFTGRGFIALLNIIVLVVGIAIVLLAINWKLALLSLTVFPLLLRTAINFTKTFRPLSLAMQQQLAVLTTVLQENLAGARVVRAFAREPEQTEGFRKVNDLLLDKNI